MAWTAINTGTPNDLETDQEDTGFLEVELPSEGTQQTLPQDNSSELVIETEEDAREEEQEPADPAPKPKNKTSRKKSRAQERIRGLVADKNDLQTKYEELQAQLEEAKRERHTDRKTFAQRQKSDLETRVVTLQKQLESAIDNNNVSEVATLSTDLSTAKFRLESLEIPSDPEPQTVPKPQQRQTPQDTSLADVDPKVAARKANKWMRQNSWSLQADANPELVNLTDEVTRELLEEGDVAPDEDDFYEELSARVAQYAEEEGLTIPGKAPKREKVKSAPVSRGTSATHTTTKSGVKSVKLSKSELDIAEMMGLTPQEYAEGKLMNEAAKGDNGYTLIK